MYRAYVYLYVVFMYVCCWPLSSTCELSWWRDVYFPLLRNTLLWSIFLQSPVSLPYSKVSKNLVRIYWKISLIYKPHAYLSFQHSTHQRSVEVQFGRYQKNILQEWSMVKNLSCVSCAAWNFFPLNFLLLPITAKPLKDFLWYSNNQ